MIFPLSLLTFCPLFRFVFGPFSGLFYKDGVRTVTEKRRDTVSRADAGGLTKSNIWMEGKGANQQPNPSLAVVYILISLKYIMTSSKVCGA